MQAIARNTMSTPVLIKELMERISLDPTITASIEYMDLEDSILMNSDKDIGSKKYADELKAICKELDPYQAYHLVKNYYDWQKYRITAASQIRAAQAINKPFNVLAMQGDTFKTLERITKAALNVYVSNHPIGKWMLNITGLGAVISAAFLSCLDITLAPAAGSFHRFAGQDPSLKWLGAEKAKKLLAQCRSKLDEYATEDPELLNKEDMESDEAFDAIETEQAILKSLAMLAGTEAKRTPEKFLALAQKFSVDNKTYQNSLTDGLPSAVLTAAGIEKALSLRPWNAFLKKICFLLGESFKKTSGKEDAFYGHFYLKKKAYYILKNEEGGFADRAKEILAEKKYGKETESYKAYIQGRLPKGHIDAMAKRAAVSLFISHLHQVMYEHEYNKPAPTPYVIAHKNHKDLILPPNYKPLFNDAHQGLNLLDTGASLVKVMNIGCSECGDLFTHKARSLPVGLPIETQKKLLEALKHRLVKQIDATTGEIKQVPICCDCLDQQTKQAIYDKVYAEIANSDHSA